jgi:hypothetical protein
MLALLETALATQARRNEWRVAKRSPLASLAFETAAQYVWKGYALYLGDLRILLPVPGAETKAGRVHEVATSQQFAVALASFDTPNL